MRLNRCVQIAVGLVAGGSVVFILNGSALAATNSQDTIIQNGQTRTTSNSNVSPAALPPAGPSANGGQTAGSGQDQTTAPDASGSGVAPAGSGTSQTTTGSGSTVVQSSSDVTQSSSTTPPATVGGAGKGDGGTPGGSAGVGAGGATPVSPVSNANMAPAGSVAEMTVVTPVVTASSVATTDRKTMLPIQPVITNRSTDLSQDLAATVPSAPAPARAPDPAKSSGLLGSLVVGLAGVVVPQPFVPSADLTYTVMLAASLATLVVLLLNVFFFSYGLWLRRGGFATAARSDMPLTRVASSFATPLLLGYVTSPPDLHSPILMVAETKTRNQFVPTAYRKEDMR